MTLWNDMIVGLCLLLLVWLLWKEIRRTNRLRLPARIAASVVAVICLACLALPLSYNRKNRKPISGKEGILLTEGYDPDSLRQLLQTARTGEKPGGEMQVFSALEDGGTVSLAGVTDLRATGVETAVAGTAAADGTTNLAQLHVLGYGLTRQQWMTLQPPLLVFHPSALHTGMVSVSWKHKLLPGEKCRVQGRIGPTTGKPVKLLLTGMGLGLDSVVIAATTKETDFELNTIPAQSGRSVYQLLVLSQTEPGKETGAHGTASAPGTAGVPGSASTHGIAGAHSAIRIDTLEQESLPIEVLPAKKLKILLLAASPDFENTFLANWLARGGHAVAVRTAISRGKWDKAYLNMPETSLDPLTPSLLDKFDLVIADAAALQEGNDVERTGLRGQVAEKGLGLIIKTDSVARGWGGIPVVPLLKDSLSKVLVSNGIYGAGKVVFTTLNTTYSRMLAGAKKEYAAYWSLLLQKAARESTPEEDWQFAPHLPRVDEPVEALLQTNKNTLPQGQFISPTGDPTTAYVQEADAPAHGVYLAQDPWLSFFWRGTYWPKTVGWQTAASLQGEPSWWYAWSGKDWLPLTRRQRWKETEEYIAARAAGPAEADREMAADRAGTDRGPAAVRTETERPTAAGERIPVPKVWFYIFFMISCVFLWVERKI